MTYTNATFYIDDGLVSGVPGSDAVRATLSAVVFSNPGSTTVLGTKTAHGLVTGAVITISGCTKAYANDVWKVTRIDANTFTLDTALWASFTGADVTGDCVPFGGSSWSDAWATISSGATAARIAPGDTIKIAKSPAPASVGNATWTNGPPIATQTITSSTNATPIVITKAAHGYVNGDIVQITSHATNTAANGTWVVANKTANTFELVGSVGNGVGGATGTVRNINYRTVYLDTAQNVTVDACETVWTAKTGLITVLDGTPTAGGTGYTVGDVLTITTGGTGAQATVTTAPAGVVTAVTLLKGGNGGYTTGSGEATSGGTGSGCTLNITTIASATAALVTASTSAKEGENSLRLTTPVSVKAGSMIAFRAISPGSLTSYQKLSFWIRNSSSITNAAEWRVCLCSDASGVTVVDEFLIPAISSAGNWLPLTLARTGGGNLGASISSIAVYTNTTAPASSSNILLDNFVASTTSGLSLQSLISKNSAEQGGSETWYGIQSIKGRIVLLDTGDPTIIGRSSVDTGLRGYSGVTANVATYIRNTIKTSLAPTSGTLINTINDGGSVAGGNISFSGGWDPVGGVNQDGETIYDGLNGLGYGIYLTAKTYTTLGRISAVRYSVGFFYDNSSNNTATDIVAANNNSTYGVYQRGCSNNSINTLMAGSNGTTGIYFLTSCRNTVDGLKANNNSGGSGCQFSTTSHNNTLATVTAVSNNGLYGVDLASDNNTIYTLTEANNNGVWGAYFSGANNVILIGASFSGNAVAQVGNTGGRNYINNATLIGTETSGAVGFADSFLWSQNHDLAGYHWGFTDGGTINSEATDRSGGTGSMWRMTVSSSTRSSTYPLTLSLAKIACVANKLVTVKAWFKKSHATNINAQLVCFGGQLAGVPSDVVATKANDTVYEELTITFTPTEAGVIEVEAQTYYVAATGSAVVEDMTITQAV